MLRAPLPVLLLAALALAGCVAEPASLQPGALPGGAVPALAYPCLGGAAGGGAAPCVAAVTPEDAYNAEPYVAAHPTDPRVWAIGTNHGPRLLDFALGAPTHTMGMTRMGLYVTEDGGATWREGFVPSPGDGAQTAEPAILDIVGDPAMVFDEQGRLHVTGLASVGTPQQLAAFVLGQGDNGVRAFYARSDDLGRTWAVGPVVLDDNGMFQDRNWLARDPASGMLYVLWQNIGDPSQVERSERTVQVAWSADGGHTWSTQPREQQAPCARAGPVAMEGPTLLFACDRLEGNDAEALAHDVYAFEAATGAATLRGSVAEDGAFPGLARLADGRLVMAWWTCFQQPDCAPDTKLATSDDGGATWSEPVSLRDLVEEGWDNVQLMWASPDPWGGLHLLVALDREAGEPLPDTPPEAGFVWPPWQHERRHLALTRDLAKVSEGTLAAWHDLDRVAPAPALPFGGDHFHGMAWRGEQALFAVTGEAAILAGALGRAA